MKKIISIFFAAIFLFGVLSCSENSIQKPDKLIPEKQFIDILVDIYLVKEIRTDPRFNGAYKSLSDDDLFYSILKKYQLSDTVFTNSMVYYSSFPKDFEKMHTQVLNILNEKEAELKKQEELNISPQ